MSYYFTFLFIVCTSLSWGQNTMLFSKGNSISILDNTFMHVIGGVKVENGGEIQSPSFGYLEGKGSAHLSLTGSLINNNDSTVLTKKGLNLRLGPLRVDFEGDSVQEIAGTTPVYFAKIGINKTDSFVVFQNRSEIYDTVYFTKGNFLLADYKVELITQEEKDNGFLLGESDSSRFFGTKKGKGYLLVNYVDYNPMILPLNQGLGISVNINGSGAQFGDTRFIRSHAKLGGSLNTDGGPGDGSIRRFFDIEITNSDEAQIQYHYFDAELDSIVESELTTWKSKKTTIGYGGKWEREEPNGNIITNEFASEFFSISKNRITLAPYTCKDPSELSLPDTLYLCVNDSIELDPSSFGAQYSWSTGDTSATIFAKEEGEYSITVIDAVGCVSQDTVRVIGVNKPKASVFPIIPVCEGDTSHFIDQSMSDNSLTYFWEFGEVTAVEGDTSIVKDPKYTFTTSGTFEVSLTVTNVYGCVDDTLVEALVSPNPKVSFVAQNACSGDTVVFSSTSTISNGGYLLYWDFGDSSPVTSGTNPTHLYQSEGSYTVTLVGVSGAACSDTTISVLDIYTKPEASFDYTGSCVDSLFSFTNTSLQKNNVQFEWSFGDGTGSFDSLVVMTYTKAGAYSVMLTAQTNEFCSDTAKSIVLVNQCREDVDCTIQAPVVNLGSDQLICEGDSVVLSVDTNYTVLWSNRSVSKSLIAKNQGKYTVQVQNDEGCIAYDEMELSVTLKPSVSLGADQFVCGSGEAQLKASISTNQPVVLTWGGNSLVGEGTEVVVRNSGKYWVHVEDDQGCGFKSSDTIVVYPVTNPPVAQFLVYSTLTVGEKAEFIQLAGESMDSYFWDFGDLSTSDEQFPVHAFATKGIYDVQFTVSKGGCESSIIKQVEVSMPNVTVPIITPDTSTTVATSRSYQVPQPDLYPNPTQGIIYYELALEEDEPIKVDVLVYDLFGRIILEKSVTNTKIKLALDLSSYDDGIFFVKTVVSYGSNVTRISKDN